MRLRGHGAVRSQATPPISMTVVPSDARAASTMMAWVSSMMSW